MTNEELLRECADAMKNVGDYLIDLSGNMIDAIKPNETLPETIPNA